MEENQTEVAQEAEGQEVEQVAEQVTEQVEAVPAQKDDVEVLKKRLADTQAWAHQNAQQLAEARRLLDERRERELRQQVQPEVLGAVDAAIEAREIQKRREVEGQQQAVVNALYEAVPDLREIETDPEFSKHVAKHAEELRAKGKDPMRDPLAAIRAVNAARVEFFQERARLATEEAQKAAKQTKLSAMSVPGASAASSTKEAKDWRQDADAVKSMSAEDFAKMRAKALGF